MNRQPTHLEYWGKAKPDNDGPAFHRLAYHSLDVAAVGVAFLDRSPAICAFFMSALQIESKSALQSWFGFFLALHDLGKFSEAFQSQRSEIFAELRQRQPDPGKPYGLRHDTLGWMIWEQYLADIAIENQWFGEDGESLMDGVAWWVRACTGHHGQPPISTSAGHWRQHFSTPHDAQAIKTFIDELFDLFHPAVLRTVPAGMGAERLETVSRQISWWIAGLAVMCDWIGSNTDFFPYCSERTELGKYWIDAQALADSALTAAGVLPTPHTEQSFRELFPDIPSPSPLQTWVIEAKISPTPQIHLLEDVTGAGKTEAAITLTQRMIASGCADGFFVALPTMATANAMYGRIAEVYRKLFDGDPSLVLSHGQRNLVEAFADSVLPAPRDEGDRAQLDDTASARCSAWLADHNKRALLAQAGVGTIDQILLSVLYSKHQSLRLLGMLRKVLIIDEVHACDDYMQHVLETVLEFHARAGGSVVLLSATLPQHMKDALFDAFARGRGAPLPVARPSCDFPLVTSWSEGLSEPSMQAIEARKAVCRSVDVHYVSDEQTVVAAIRAALAAGRCVCWMRNTVADALAACAQFEHELDAEHLILFHARFALRDRLDTEQRILKHFGKSSTPEERAGRLVIATQVAEQSLDADWDFVVTDLAPIDRLIQRAGRLQRHPRDTSGRRHADPTAQDERGRPCLWVFGPEWTETPAPNWFKTFLPKAAGVYPNHALLWLTAKALQFSTFTMPGDARSLIEGVFGEHVDLPDGLQANAGKAEGDTYANISMAMQNTLKPAAGYVRDAIDWWSEASTPSRLGEATMTVVLARWEGNRLRPWVDHETLRHAWAYSTVKVAERLIAERIPESDPVREQAVLNAMESLPGSGKWSALLVLNETNGRWTATAYAKTDRGNSRKRTAWAYCPKRGLQNLEVPDA